VPYRKLNPLPPISQKHIKNFWSHVEIADKESCWIWTGSKSHQGYGKLLLTIEGRPYHCKAIRVAYFIGHGKDPYPLCVLHHCDNPSCVNPSHLFLGTDADNMMDMAKKGRSSHRKLSGADVKQILADVAAGHTQTDLAARFGVCQQAISRIVLGKICRCHTNL
jgi:hypothetical protein